MLSSLLVPPFGQLASVPHMPTARISGESQSKLRRLPRTLRDKGVCIMRKPFQHLGKVAGAFFLALICVVSAAAQVTTGNVSGTVTDPQGAAVPGADVTLTDKNTGQSQTAQTSDTGEFRFNNLQPGNYTITIKGQNFKTLTQIGRASCRERV